ncbi:hypothetical protein [Clostridium oceanicum]|uniref:DUF3796 domain-containing protein n=1 Tax=Clostridium oceanicum TaxID=1543 RepID=A0ABP3V847_9CLOT
MRKYGFFQLDLNYNDERIDQIENKISTEVYNIGFTLALFYYLYRRYCFGERANFLIAFLLIVPIYRDIRLSMKGGYNFTRKNIRTSRFALGFFIVYLFNCIYNFIGDKVSLGIYLITTIVVTTLLVTFYKNFLNLLCNRWENENLVND